LYENFVISSSSMTVFITEFEDILNVWSLVQVKSDIYLKYDSE